MPYLTIASKLLANWRVLAIGVAAVGVFSGGYELATWKYGLQLAEAETQRLKAINENAALIQKIEAANQALTHTIAELEVERRKKAEMVERVIEQEVIKYVETDNARECGLSGAGVMLHDAAAAGRVPSTTQSATGTDGRAIEATNAQVIRVVTDNYATCNETRNQLILLQQWVRGIQDMEATP